MTVQVYVAVSAGLLLRLGAGRKPTKRTSERLCSLFAGWAAEQEVLDRLDKLRKADDSS